MSKEKIVRFEDRDEFVENLRIGLRTVGFNVTYPEAALMNELYKMVVKLGGKMTIRDSTRLQRDWTEGWKEYFKTK